MILLKDFVTADKPFLYSLTGELIVNAQPVNHGRQLPNQRNPMVNRRERQPLNQREGYRHQPECQRMPSKAGQPIKRQQVSQR